MTFGENIKRIRKEKGISQQALGEKLGVKQQTVAQYEKSKYAPKFTTLKKIADALEVDIGELDDRSQSITQTVMKLIRLEERENYILEKIHSDTNLKENTELQCKLSDIRKEIENTTILLTKLKLSQKEYMEEHLIENYNMLNQKGQDKAIEQVEMLTKIPEYRKEES